MIKYGRRRRREKERKNKEEEEEGGGKKKRKKRRRRKIKDSRMVKLKVINLAEQLFLKIFWQKGHLR